LETNDIPEKKLPGVKFVRLLLLQRIQNDLRCCVLLVERGYALQAAALAAGIYEAWVTIANIKSDKDAVKWLSHAKKNESFGKIYELTKKALTDRARMAGADLKEVKKKVKEYYSLYGQLCTAKHLNPMVERNRGYDFDPKDKSVRFRPGPDTTERELAMG